MKKNMQMHRKPKSHWCNYKKPSFQSSLGLYYLAFIFNNNVHVRMHFLRWYSTTRREVNKEKSKINLHRLKSCGKWIAELRRLEVILKRDFDMRTNLSLTQVITVRKQCRVRFYLFVNRLKYRDKTKLFQTANSKHNSFFWTDFGCCLQVEILRHSKKKKRRRKNDRYQLIFLTDDMVRRVWESFQFYFEFVYRFILH